MATADSTSVDPIRWETPPQIAARLGVKDDTVRGWCKSGELKAANLAKAGCQRPRYHVNPLDLAIFLERRSAGPTPKAPRRRPRNDDVIQFYK